MGVEIKIEHLTKSFGKQLIWGDVSLVVPAGEICVMLGPSGTGKSTFFRVVAGIWPFGSGTIAVPAGARVTVMPQQPYFPIATLAAAVTYPDAPGTFDSAQLAEALTAVGLPQLVERLDQEAHWNRVLSPGEQRSDEELNDEFDAQLLRWVELASRTSDQPIYYVPGNDDPMRADKLLVRPFVNVHGRHVALDDRVSILGVGGSTETPITGY